MKEADAAEEAVKKSVPSVSTKSSISTTKTWLNSEDIFLTEQRLFLAELLVPALAISAS